MVTLSASMLRTEERQRREKIVEKKRSSYYYNQSVCVCSFLLSVLINLVRHMINSWEDDDSLDSDLILAKSIIIMVIKNK